MEKYNFIKSAKTWDDIFQVLSALNKTDIQKAGKHFEIFCKYYLIHKENFKSVKLLSEVDPVLLEKLNIQSKDHGCDLILTTKDNKHAIVQCKFTSNQEDKTLGWTNSNLSSFLAASSKAEIRIIFTNASGVSKTVIKKAQEKDYRQYCFAHLNELTQLDIKAIYSLIQGKKPKKVFYTPRPHQKEALKKVIANFKKESRGKLILPCGAGKTLTALWIKEKLKAKKTLILVPSLSLLRQFKNDWLAQGKKNSDYFCVCSEKDIAGPDSNEMNPYEVGGTVTTNPKEIKLLLFNKNPQIVFATYQSSPQIAIAMKGTKLKFDLVICDEAHRTSGERISAFATILDDKKIKASKCLFMTATPRIVSETVKDKLGNEKYKYLADMNDEALYGKEFFYMNFGDAIKKNPAFLTDYKIIAVGVTDEEVANWIKERRFAKGTTVNDIAHNYALHKVMTKYKAQHAITFHARVSSAQKFKERHEEMYNNVALFHVSGTQSSSQRALALHKFANSKQAVITNARCLTEGVDVPAIDMVYFCDPRSSKIDIVQATGRALRIHKGKKLGFIVVPLFHKKDANTEKSIEEGNYKALIQVVRAMADQDARIEEEIKFIKYGLGPYKKISSKIEINLGLNSRIELIGFEEKLKTSIFTQVISRSVVNWRPYNDAQRFVHALKLKSNKDWRLYSKSGKKPDDIPASPDKGYKGRGWKGYGDWLGTGIVATNDRIYLSFKDARTITHNLKFKNYKEWSQYLKSGAKPHNIPANPDKVYKLKGWKGYGDWLGTGIIAARFRKYRSFQKARAFVHKLNLKNENEWRDFSKSDKKPNDIPATPSSTYKSKGWKGYGDWLGTGTIASRLMNYQSFKQSRLFVHTLRLKSASEWNQYCESGQKPSNLPASPEHVYKNRGWKHWGDWLGTKNVSTQERKYRQFRDARNYVQKLKLKNLDEWRAFCKSGKKPEDIPANPNRVYRSKGWEGTGNWLGTGTLATQKRIFRSFKKSQTYVHNLKLRSQLEWNNYCKSGKKPLDIPTTPSNTYKNRGWTNWGDWLGTKRIATQERKYRQFREARNYVQKLKLKNLEEWRAYCKSGKKPEDIPANPNRVYGSKGWEGAGNWLGTERVATRNRVYRSFNDARAFVHKLKLKSHKEWVEYYKADLKPNDIPAQPENGYKNLGWNGYGDWLGTGTIASQNKNFRSFKDALNFVHNLKLKNTKEWKLYCKSGKKPDDIPATPRNAYKNKGWISMSHWLKK